MGVPFRVAAAEPQAGLTAHRRTAGAILLAIGLVASFGLWMGLLDRLVPYGWSGSLQAIAGALLCMSAGWIASAIWSKSKWNQSMARQVAIWRRITDAWFAWVEDIQVSTEALNRLKVSLEEAVPSETA